MRVLNPSMGPNPNRIVIGNRNAMDAVWMVSLQPDVAPGLPNRSVSEALEYPTKLACRNIARDLMHT
mgnify:FL=1